MTRARKIDELQVRMTRVRVGMTRARYTMDEALRSGSINKRLDMLAEICHTGQNDPVENPYHDGVFLLFRTNLYG